jgi:hypothetical protein
MNDKHAELCERLESVREVLVERDCNHSACIVDEAIALLQAEGRDAARFQHLQNIPVVEAQAFFWRYSSRRERAKAIDASITAGDAK